MRRSGIWSHWSGGVVATVVVCAFCAGIGVTAVNAARSTASRATQREATPSADLASERAALAGAVSFLPKPNTRDVPLDAPVVVATKTGALRSVRVTTPRGTAVVGRLAPSKRAWSSKSPLESGTAYRVTAVVSGSSGVTTRLVSAFRTLTPAAQVHATVFPSDGMTVGVAQPVVIRFDHYIGNAWARIAVLDHLSVTVSHPVPGGWHWFSNDELHLRPKTFWPVGEKITVATDLDGWNAGGGLWGTGQVVEHFAIGDAHVAVADLATDQMQVTDNGRLIATYPFSGGRSTDPTMNGTHIVLDTETVVRMVSSTNGVPVNSPDGYDELVYADVHITDSGEYVHAAPWSVTSQGRTNVSHGCINLSPANALAFYAFSRVGDVVTVIGGPRPPAPGDHGVMDWDTAWDQWTPAAMHSAAAPARTTPKPTPSRAR